MHALILFALLTLAPFMADAGGTAHCTTQEEPALKRWVTTCSDGARATTPYDAPLNRYRTDVIMPPKGDKPPLGPSTPGNPWQ